MFNQLLDSNKDNFLYVPGIATYGIDGKTGETGTPGTCIFYSNYSIEDNGDGTKNKELETVLKAIIANKVLVKYDDATLTREYMTGDYIIFSSGDIYKMINVENLKSTDEESIQDLHKDDFFERVGRLSTENDSSNYFKMMGTNRIALDSSYNGLDIFYKSADVENLQSELSDTEDYILRVVGEKNNTNKVFLISLSSKYNTDETNYLNLYYDNTDSAFHIDSNRDILLNAKTLQVKTDASVNTYDNYSSVMTWDNPDTEFIKIVKKFKYVIDDTKLKLSFSGDAEEIIPNTERFNSSVYVRSFDTESGLSKFNRYEFVCDETASPIEIQPIDISNAGDEIISVSFIYNIECFVNKDESE